MGGPVPRLLRSSASGPAGRALLSSSEGGLSDARGGPDWPAVHAAIVASAAALTDGEPIGRSVIDDGALRLLCWLCDPMTPSLQPVEVTSPALPPLEGVAHRPVLAYRVESPARAAWLARWSGRGRPARRWHGTRFENAHSVLHRGLRVLSGSRHMRTGDAHGSGVYLGHGPAVALSYATDPASERASGRGSACLAPAGGPLAAALGTEPGPRCPPALSPLAGRLLLAVDLASGASDGVAELDGVSVVSEPALLSVSHVFVFGPDGEGDVRPKPRASAADAPPRPVRDPVVSWQCAAMAAAAVLAVAAAHALAISTAAARRGF